MAPRDRRPIVAVDAADEAPRPRQVLYPDVFADRMVGRV